MRNRTVSRSTERRRRLHKFRNRLQSLLLLGAMLLIFGLSGYAVGGGSGIAWALVAGGLLLAFSPRMAPAFVMRMYRARRLSRAEFPEGYAILDGLARRAGLRRPPELFHLPSPMLNAFAVGRPEESAIGVTDGLLQALTTREFAGVLAHEISHVRNNDLWVMGLADTLSRVVALMAWMGQLLFFLNLPLLVLGEEPFPWLLVIVLVAAPTLVALLQLALSRAREYDADLDAAELTGDPRGLAAALVKLERFQGRLWESVLLPGRHVPDPSLLRTHPPTQERVRRLLELEEGAPEADATPGGRLAAPPPVRVVGPAPRWHWPGVWY